MVTIRPTHYAEILSYPAAQGLLSEYSEECSIPEIGSISPQGALYEAMQSSGLMKTFGAFEGDDLVGFATILIYVLPHYGQKVATVESIFVKKSSRGKVGRKLMEEIEAQAKSAGCKVIMYSARASTRLERLLLSLKCYANTNSIFTRKLQ